MAVSLFWSMIWLGATSRPQVKELTQDFATLEVLRTAALKKQEEQVREVATSMLAISTTLLLAIVATLREQVKEEEKQVKDVATLMLAIITTLVLAIVTTLRVQVKEQVKDAATLLPMITAT